MGSTNNPALSNITFCSDCHDDAKARQKTEIPYNFETIKGELTRHKLQIDTECDKCGNNIASDTYIYSIPDQEEGGHPYALDVCLECFKQYVQGEGIRSEVIAEVL